MKTLKSIFISGYMMLAMGISGYAGWMIYQGENLIAWSGVLLATSPMMLVLSRLLIFQNEARTSAHFPMQNVLGFIGAILAIWVWINNQTGVLAPALASLG